MTLFALTDDAVQVGTQQVQLVNCHYKREIDQLTDSLASTRVTVEGSAALNSFTSIHVTCAPKRPMPAMLTRAFFFSSYKCNLHPLPSWAGSKAAVNGAESNWGQSQDKLLPRLLKDSEINGKYTGRRLKRKIGYQERSSGDWIWVKGTAPPLFLTQWGLGNFFFLSCFLRSYVRGFNF